MNGQAKKRYKDIDLPFTCPITNREFNSTKGLSVYVTKTLKIPHEEYYDEHVNHRDSDCFFCGSKGEFISIGKGYRNLCNDTVCMKKSFSSHTVEGFMYKNMCDREEAESLFEVENKRQLKERIKSHNKLRKEDPLWDKKRARNCIEFWLEKGLIESDAQIKLEKSLKDFQTKSAKTIRDNPEKYASKFPTKIEYYTKRGYSEKEGREIISKIQNRFSLDGCIGKYGEVKGQKVWQERQERWMFTMNSKSPEEKKEINRKKIYNHSGFSKISQKLFLDVYYVGDYVNNKIYFEELCGEFIRYDITQKKHYKYDYIDNTNKKVIEFNGDYWHCNPLKYNENYHNSLVGKFAKDICKSDSIKNDFIKSEGFDVLVIWESDYRKNPEQTLEKCIQFLDKK